MMDAAERGGGPGVSATRALSGIYDEPPLQDGEGGTLFPPPGGGSWRGAG